jgi:hypothetical protein
VLGSLDVTLSPERLLRLDAVSKIEFGFPYHVLRGPEGHMVCGDLEPQSDLPRVTPYRWPSACHGSIVSS